MFLIKQVSSDLGITPQAIYKQKEELQNKGYTQTCAEWMAERIESLIDHMQYGHALIAFYKQDGTFNTEL